MGSSLIESRPSGGTEHSQQYGVPRPEFRPPHPQHSPAKLDTHKVQHRLGLEPAEGWFSMLMLAVAVYSVVYSIIGAQWVADSTILLYSTACGLLVGLLVAKIRRFPQAILHLAACLAGHWLSIWLTSMIAEHVSWLLLLENLRAVISGGLVSSSGNSGEMVFLFYLTFLCFFLGYFGAWLIYRAHLPWLVALVYCSIMLVNLQYAKSDLSLLTVILLGALLMLIARMQLNNQLAQWMQEGLHTDREWLRNITRRFMQIATLLTLLILPLSLLLPVLDQPSSGVSFWNTLDNAWTNITHGQFAFTNPGLFQGNQAATNFFGDELSITGSVNLPTGQVLYYTSTGNAPAQYLEGFTYDRFDGHTWTSPASNQNLQQYSANATLPLVDLGNVSEVITSITIVVPPDGTKHYIFAPAQPYSFDVPTVLYSSNGNGSGMPTAWTQQGPLSANEQYHVKSLIPTPSPEDLSAISFPSDWTNDPNYAVLSQYYLQTPADLSPNVLKVAQQWTNGATNTYQAMKMLESHFTDPAHFTYSISNPPVPGNIDAVSWLLQTRRGFCTYYATAMTMMARLLGVPARMVNGFNQGHFDAHRKVWEVDGDNAHSWVQVYFPGQGWISFDPTPGFSLDNPTNPQPTQTPGQTPTPARPKPTATATHPTSGTHPTPTSGVGGTGSNTSVLGDTQRQMVFLGISLIILVVALLVLAMAIYRYKFDKLYANASLVSALYWRVSRLASLSGVPPRESQTPYEYTRVLSQRFPRVKEPLWRITHLFVRERWGAQHHSPGAAEEKDIERLWPRIRGTFLRALIFRFHRHVG